MKRKVMALLLAICCSFSLVACGSDAEMSSAVRGPETDNGLVYIDEEAVALAGSMLTAEMTEEERARAEELRAMAVEAFELVNAERAAAGLPAYIWDEELEACAQVRAIEIVTTFSHTRPNGTDWWTVNSDLMWGENLAKGYRSATSVVDAWMNSPSHAANIMNGTFVTCSIAIYEIDSKLYFAQEFGY